MPRRSLNLRARDRAGVLLATTLLDAAGVLCVVFQNAHSVFAIMTIAFDTCLAAAPVAIYLVPWADGAALAPQRIVMFEPRTAPPAAARATQSRTFPSDCMYPHDAWRGSRSHRGNRAA